MSNVPSWLQLNAQARRRPTGKHQTTVRQFVIPPAEPGSPQAPSPAPLTAASPLSRPTVARSLSSRATPSSQDDGGASSASAAMLASPPPLSHAAKRRLDLQASPTPVLKRPAVEAPRSVSSSKSAVRPAVSSAPPPSSSSSTAAASAAEPSPEPDERRPAPQKVKVARYGPGSRTINAMDVVLTTVLSAEVDYKGGLAVRLPELDQFAREAEVELTTQSQLLDEHRLITAGLRKSTTKKRTLRQQLLRTQRAIAEADARRQAAQRQLDELRTERLRRNDEARLLEGLRAMRERLSGTAADAPPAPTLESSVVAAAEGVAALERLRFVNGLLAALSSALDDLS